MKKLLIPLDFSETSRIGLNYALELAKILTGKKYFIELILLNVFNVPVVDPLGLEASTEIMDAMEEQARQEMENWLNYAKQKAPKENIKIRSEVRMGFAIPEILSVAEEEDVDLIIITHQGENSLIEKVFGSVALGIIEGSHVPVLSVPINTEYEPIRKAFFSTNILTLDVYSLTLAVNFCKDIESSIHFFTIIDEKFHFPITKVKKVYEELMKFLILKDWQKDQPTELLETLETYYSPSYAVVETKDVVKGIENYVKHHKPDMLILAKRHRSFLQSFLSKSITLNIVRDLSLPVLVLPTYVKI